MTRSACALMVSNLKFALFDDDDDGCVPTYANESLSIVRTA